MTEVKLIIMGFLLSLTVFSTSVSANECISEDITINNTVTSEWTIDCDSAHRNGSYAKYYTFTLNSPESVTIDLSSEIDTYLYLISGTDQSAVPIAENDDFNDAHHSQIKMNLVAGTYTIEATTYEQNEFANFELSLTGVLECTSEITFESTLTGTFEKGCSSEHRTGSYAKYYTFTLANPESVIINLDSSIDPYLFLISGTNQNATPITENDDHNGVNSQISMDLPAGTYTIEATTYSSNQSGSFELSLGEVMTKTFKGQVTLPKEILNLLNSCVSEECPSISVNMHTSNFQQWGGASVDYNETTQAYEYQFAMTERAIDNTYFMNMYIQNGDRGSESLVYSFGADHQVGGTGDAEDVMYHSDELWNNERPKTVEPLALSANTETVIVDLDFSNKNVGRHKVTGTIHLPTDIDMFEIVEEDGYSYYKNSLQASISGQYTGSWVEVDRETVNENNDYSFVTSLPHNLPEVSKLSISLYGNLYDSQIQARYDVNASKFISGWSSLYENSIMEFDQTIADFGTLNMASYLDGYELVRGSLVIPNNFKERGDYRHMSMFVYSSSFYANTGIDLYDYNESNPPEFSIFIPGSEKNTIKQGGLKFRVQFSWATNDSNGNYATYYGFGEDSSVGGEGVNADKLLEGCIDPNSATPLIVDTSDVYPRVDLDLREYNVPYTFKAKGTLSVPSNITNLYFYGHNRNCNSFYNAWGWAQNNGDGTWSYEIYNLLENNEYAIEVNYSEESNNNSWYNYVLNNNNMDLTTEGVFLDEIRYEDTIIYPDPLATITGSADEEIVIAPFEFILHPPQNTGVSPAIIMYLLN